jgi:hypothetical protein
VSDEPSSHATTPGTPGYLTGTAGYPRGEGGGSGVDEGQASAARGPRRGDEYWRSLGFSSQREFNKAFEHDQRRIGEKWRRRRAAPAVPAASMPGDDIADIPRVGRRKPVHQVRIKLRPDDYDALARAARLYGARPTTLARLLVNRGVRAVLDGERND